MQAFHRLRDSCSAAMVATGAVCLGANLALAEAPAVSTITDSSAAVEGTVLRWKTKRERGGEASTSKSRTILNASYESAAPQRTNIPEPTGGWNRSPIGSQRSNLTSSDGTIRLVAHDPFRDPFGDKSAQAGPSLVAPAGGLRQVKGNAAKETAVHELPAPQEEATEPAPSLTRPQAPANEAQPDESNQPMPDSATEPMDLPMADPDGATGPIYNDRDCQTDEANCKKFMDSLRAVPLTRISLDIMPRFVPDAETPDEDKSKRVAALATSQIRDWHDHTGQVLATGRLTDLQHNRVIIADEAGEEVARLPLGDLGRDEICYIAGWWRLPAECLTGDRSLVTRDWVPSTFAWTASALCHKPLYFEQPQLERYGHTAGPFKQPIISGVHFFASIGALPYKMAINPPMECQYPLGTYRPGSCAPWHIPPVPLSLRGAVAEAGAWIGGIYIIP